MSTYAHTLRDAYHAAIARTRAASETLDGLEPGTELFGRAAEDLSCCMRAEMEAGRSLMAAQESLRSPGADRRRGRYSARRLGREAAPSDTS